MPPDLATGFVIVVVVAVCLFFYHSATWEDHLPFITIQYIHFVHLPTNFPFGNPLCPLYLSIFVYFFCLLFLSLQMSEIIYLVIFSSEFFCLAYYAQGPSMFSQMAIFHYFIAELSSIVRINCIFLIIYPQMNTGSFHILDIANNAVMNTGVSISF